MPKSLKSFIGVVLLVLSVGVTSCQAFLGDGVPARELDGVPSLKETLGD